MDAPPFLLLILFVKMNSPPFFTRWDIISSRIPGSGEGKDLRSLCEKELSSDLTL